MLTLELSSSKKRRARAPPRADRPRHRTRRLWLERCGKQQRTGCQCAEEGWRRRSDCGERLDPARQGEGIVHKRRNWDFDALREAAGKKASRPSRSTASGLVQLRQSDFPKPSHNIISILRQRATRRICALYRVDILAATPVNADGASATAPSGNADQRRRLGDAGAGLSKAGNKPQHRVLWP